MSMQYPTIPKPIARLIDEPRMWSDQSTALPTLAKFEIEYPWSDWSQWERCGPEEIVSDEEVGFDLVAAEVSLFKVLRYAQLKRYRTKYRQRWARFRRNARGEYESEVRDEYRTEVA